MLDTHSLRAQRGLLVRSFVLGLCLAGPAPCRDALEPNDLPGTGAKVVLPSRLAGLTLHPPVGGLGDVDRFSVSLERGRVLTVHLLDPGDSPLDPLLVVLDPQRRVVRRVEGIDGFTFGATSLTAREAGTYEVVVTGRDDFELQGAHTQVGGYGLALRVEAPDANEPNDEPIEARLLPVLPAEREGVLGTAEMDWFRLPVRRDARYRVQVLDPWDSPLDARLGVFDVTGSQRWLEALDTFSRFPALGFTSPVDGFVLLAITGQGDAAYLGAHEDAGAYRLRVVEETGDAREPNDTVASAVLLTWPHRETLQLEPGDVDWFAIDVVQGRQYRVRTSDPGGETLATRLGLFDHTGTRTLRTADARTAADPFSELIFRADRTGRLTFAVTGAGDASFQGTHARRGVYVLDLREDPFEPNDEFGLARVLPRDVRLGPLLLAPGDTDWFLLDARAGERFLLRTQALDTEVPDLRIGVFGPASNPLRSVETGRGGAAPELDLPITATGRYVLAVTGGGDQTYFGAHAIRAPYFLECLSLHPTLTPFATSPLGPLAGGGSLRLRGTNFTTLRDVAVRFGTRSAVPISLPAAGELVVDVPAGTTEGVVDLTLTNLNGSTTLPASYRYIQTTSVRLGETFVGGLTPSDTDFVHFDGLGGTRIDLDLRGRRGDPLVDPQLLLYDAAFRSVTILPLAVVSEGRFRLRRFPIPPGPIGMWYAEIRSASGVPGSYELRTRRRVAAEHKKPTPVPEIGNGALDFRFAAEADSELKAQLSFLAGTDLDAVQLLDDRGLEVPGAVAAITIDRARSRVRVDRAPLPRFGEYVLRVTGPTEPSQTTAAKFRVKFPRPPRGVVFE